MLNYNVIPVVLNGVNMTNFAPPHSYIDIKDFNNSIEGKLIWKIGSINKFNLTHSGLIQSENHAANKGKLQAGIGLIT